MIDVRVLEGLFTPPDLRSRLFGVTVGLVTNNQDPDGMGRVKVRFPWLSNEDESQWARVLTPMAGADRGLYFLPEVDDEVLVAFEHGRADSPYVLGALWNGVDAPPESNDDGKNDKRTIKSRSGHVIRLDDKDGEEKIEIVDATGDNSVIIDSKENQITIKAKGDITIEAGGKLMLSGEGVEVTSKAAVSIQAAQAMDLESDTEVNVKGSMVNIN